MGTDQQFFCGNRMDGYEERRNKVRRFQLTSDIFFCKVLEDKEACQEVVRILLGHPSLVVKDVKTQYSIRNIENRSVVLDVLAEDTDGRMVNVEMQVSEDEDHQRRARYYQASMDMSFLEKGCPYEELPELYDEFASEASEFDTLDELKADIRKAAAQDAEGRQATEARDAFIAKLQEGLEIPVPKGVKANMVEEQLKGMTPDPEKATKEQKAQAEETVEKDLRDQMVLDALAEKLDVQVSQSDVFNFLASIAQQYGMDPNNFIQAIIKNGQLGSAVQEVGRSKGLLAGMRAVKFTADGEVVDLSAFLGEAAEDEESESVEAASAAAAVADELSAKDDAKDAE